MKKYIYVFALCLLFTACSKKEEKPTYRTYNLSGRIYERYDYYSFSPNRRAYFTLNFVNDTTAYKYNGTDTLGVDSVWYRKDTVMVSSPYLKPYQYSVKDRSQDVDEYLLDYVAEIAFYRWTTHTHHGEESINQNYYYFYYISDDEKWIWNQNDITDEYQRIN